jgi:hypothetical protein
MNFIEYIAKIAPEGETILFVKQKPTGGSHGDGALKCVWPAYLPEKYKGEAAWYANTACFILDRFKDGKVSAAASYCERVAFMVLDDVGTKSKTPPLEPTWKMETSPGNYQWGYTFALDDQPLKGEFSAAIKAIAEAGYTDGGAINPVRNFRLPGSLNLKPGRDNFKSTLIEFHPEREFSLKQICEALDVKPREADTAGLYRVRLDDDGRDDVLAWIYQRGEIIENANGEGWFGIVCPNASEHSDGNPTGRYHPLNRSYCCFHEHCGDWDSRRFLGWVAEQGGPKHEYGLRDELVARTMRQTYDKISPTEAFPDAAKKLIAEVERKELARVEKSEWYKRFAYIQEDESFFDMVDRREISRSTFNALFRHISCQSIHNGRRIEASVCFDENRQAMGARTLVSVTYSAGQDVLVTKDGLVYGNRWRDARPHEYGTGDVSRWLEHAERMIPNEEEREHIFNMMAFKLQNPNIKINHAVLHGGDEGSGKDTFWAPFIWSVCGPDLRNRGLVDNDSISSSWGYHLESEILIINELKEPDARERRALANKLKPIIAAPPDTLPINRKGLHPYDMVNRMFVLAFSNDPVPISLASQDRRWFCIWSHADRMNPREAASMWKWYKSGGYQDIAGWLQRRDVSAFNPAAPPMMTEFKMNLIEQGMTIAESFICDMIRSRQGEFAKGAIASPLHALCDRLSGQMPQGTKVPQAALLHALKEAGWIDVGYIASGEYTTKKHVWVAPEFKRRSKSDLRRMVEPVAGGNVIEMKKTAP